MSSPQMAWRLKPFLLLEIEFSVLALPWIPSGSLPDISYYSIIWSSKFISVATNKNLTKELYLKLLSQVIVIVLWLVCCQIITRSSGLRRIPSPSFTSKVVKKSSRLAAALVGLAGAWTSTLATSFILRVPSSAKCLKLVKKFLSRENQLLSLLLLEDCCNTA